MTRILILVLILFEVSQLFASENEDFTFIVGLYRDENYDLAQAELIRFLDSYPASDYVSDAEYLLANIYLHKGLFNDAQVIYYRLYLRYTNPAIRDNVLLGLAQSYFYLEDMEQSSKYFLIFNAEFPGHPLLWKSFYFLGRISVSKGETSKALRYYDESIRLKDAPEAYLAKLELLLETDKEKKTGEFLSEITKKFSGTTTSDKAVLLFQDFHLNDRSYDKVLEIPYQVASSSVLYPEYKVNRAAAHYEKGEARLALSELASVRTDRAEYYRALSYRQLQRNEEARAILLELEKSALSEELRVYSSFMLAEMEDDMALRNLRLMEFITRHPDSDFNGVAYYQIGFNKHEAGNYDDAVQNLEKSLLLDLDAETREKAVFLLAESQYQSGSLQESNSGYKFYLDNYSQGSYCDEALFKIGLIHY
ncbi:MAG: tetratricopeptide repeat protein, partial [Candidatus Cloacimonetes bacterium]|nr:tetratricopeptide repeat protein [Candidatus Cloacimonadota bacterium]